MECQPWARSHSSDSVPHGLKLRGLSCRGSQVALDVARGLHYLHSFKVTHFDLKSANVLLDRQLMTAKVADVGLAK